MQEPVYETPQKNLKPIFFQSPNDKEVTSRKDPVVKFEEDAYPSTLPKDSLQMMGSDGKLPNEWQTTKRKSKNPWTKEEDDILRDLVETKGAKDWAAISTYFVERCGKQCRERWHNHLRTGINKGSWSPDEEWLVLLGVHAYGKRWSMISKMLKGRTENSLKNLWNCKLKSKIAVLQKKMKEIIRFYQLKKRSLSELEVKLFDQIIANKKNIFVPEDQRTEKFALTLKKSLQNFFKVKQEIYRDFQMSCETTIPSQYLAWDHVESFRKDKKQKQQNSISFRKQPNCRPFCEPFKNVSQMNTEVKVENSEKAVKNEYASDYVCEAFELRANELSEKSLHEYEEDVFYSESEQRSEQPSMVDEAMQMKHMQPDSGSEAILDGFSSPKRNTPFQNLYLGDSIEKKRLFQ